MIEKKVDVMEVLTDNSQATMIITIDWKSDGVQHRDHYYTDDVNMWRDIFPDIIRQKLLGSQKGDTIQYSLPAREIIDRKHTPPLTLPLLHWQPPVENPSLFCPLAGRYYPQGFLQSISGVYPQTITPMRVVEANDEDFIIDLNHPLDGRQLDITIELVDISKTEKERGGRCSDRIQDALDNGPGLQARIDASPLTFDPEKAYQRDDPGNDPAFYSEPRLVSHIDSQASQHLASVCAGLLQPGDKVLDLMASINSHLPENHGIELVGLGMNSKEMNANTNLQDHVIHDLNEDSNVPFPDKSFDAVLCNLSIEYLTHPQKVIQDISRVLKNSGTLLISFSNRWFPPKVTSLWTELHDFERIGYVLQLCWSYYDNLQTYSFRNWPRPIADRHFPELLTSDPLYVITGKGIS